MRRPDKPGHYRVVRSRKGGYLLSGVRLNGSRVHIRDDSQVKLERMGKEIFGSGGAAPIISPIAPVVAAAMSDTTVDDWGLPIRVKAESVADLNASLGIAPVAPAPAGPSPEEVQEKQRKRDKNAKSIMELGGVVWATGSIWAGRRLCEATDREAPNPSKEQVENLRDVTKETLTDYFGDAEIKPWQMMILLSFGIPISMFLQARKKPSAQKSAADLKSVP